MSDAEKQANLLMDAVEALRALEEHKIRISGVRRLIRALEVKLMRVVGFSSAREARAWAARGALAEGEAAPSVFLCPTCGGEMASQEGKDGTRWVVCASCGNSWPHIVADASDVG